jgi:hypothetical protein
VLADRLGRRAEPGDDADAAWTDTTGRALLADLVAASLRLRPHAHLVWDSAEDGSCHDESTQDRGVHPCPTDR